MNQHVIVVHTYVSEVELAMYEAASFSIFNLCVLFLQH